MLKKILISPPFGDYITRPYATNVCGTRTTLPRSGLRSRVAKTLRWTRRGWVNQIGLTNDGIRSVKFEPTCMYSVAAIRPYDWHVFLEVIPAGSMVELNLGCPNMVNLIGGPFEEFIKKYSVVSAKLPHTGNKPPLNYIERLHRQGIRLFHISNTKSTERGGLSGRELKWWNPAAIGMTKKYFPDVEIIAGGGIYSPQDVYDYYHAGADYYSLSTIWFTPWRVPAVVRAIHAITGENGGT